MGGCCSKDETKNPPPLAKVDEDDDVSETATATRDEKTREVSFQEQQQDAEDDGAAPGPRKAKDRSNSPARPSSALDDDNLPPGVDGASADTRAQTPTRGSALGSNGSANNSPSKNRDGLPPISGSNSRPGTPELPEARGSPPKVRSGRSSPHKKDSTGAGGTGGSSSEEDEAYATEPGRGHKSTTVVPSGGAVAIATPSGTPVQHLKEKHLQELQGDPRSSSVISSGSRRGGSVRSASVGSVRSTSSSAGGAVAARERAAHRGSYPFTSTVDTASSPVAFKAPSVSMHSAATSTNQGYVRPMLVGSGSAASSVASLSRNGSSQGANSRSASRATISQTPSPRPADGKSGGGGGGGAPASTSSYRDNISMAASAAAAGSNRNSVRSGSSSGRSMSRSAIDRLSRPKLYPSQAMLASAARAEREEQTRSWRSKPMPYTPPPPPEAYLRKPRKQQQADAYPPPFTTPFHADVLEKDQQRLYDVPKHVDPDEFLTPRQRIEKKKFHSKLQPPGSNPSSRAGSRAGSTARSSSVGSRGRTQTPDRHGSTSRPTRVAASTTASPSAPPRGLPLGASPGRQSVKNNSHNNNSSSPSRGSALRDRNASSPPSSPLRHQQHQSPDQKQISDSQIRNRVHEVAPALTPDDAEGIAHRVAQLILEQQQQQQQQQATGNSRQVSRASSVTSTGNKTPPPSNIAPKVITSLPEPALENPRQLSPQRRTVAGTVITPKPAKMFAAVDPLPPTLWLTSPEQRHAHPNPHLHPPQHGRPSSPTPMPPQRRL